MLEFDRNIPELLWADILERVRCQDFPPYSGTRWRMRWRVGCVEHHGAVRISSHKVTGRSFLERAGASATARPLLSRKLPFALVCYFDH
jgi:hypothetical protein